MRMGWQSRELKDEKKGAMESSGGVAFRQWMCKGPGYQRLGMLEEQKEGHMARVLRPRGRLEDIREGK